MIGVVVVTHGQLATELLNAAETIVGDPVTTPAALTVITAPPVNVMRIVATSGSGSTPVASSLHAPAKRVSERAARAAKERRWREVIDRWREQRRCDSARGASVPRQFRGHGPDP